MARPYPFCSATTKSGDISIGTVPQVKSTVHRRGKPTNRCCVVPPSLVPDFREGSDNDRRKVGHHSQQHLRIGGKTTHSVANWRCVGLHGFPVSPCIYSSRSIPTNELSHFSIVIEKAKSSCGAWGAVRGMGQIATRFESRSLPRCLSCSLSPSLVLELACRP